MSGAVWFTTSAASVQAAVDVDAGDEVERKSFEVAPSLVVQEIVAAVFARLPTLMLEMIGAIASPRLVVTNEPCADVPVLFAASVFLMTK